MVFYKQFFALKKKKTQIKLHYKLKSIQYVKRNAYFNKNAIKSLAKYYTEADCG